MRTRIIISLLSDRYNICHQAFVNIADVCSGVSCGLKPGMPVFSMIFWEYRPTVNYSDIYMNVSNALVTKVIESGMSPVTTPTSESGFSYEYYSLLIFYYCLVRSPTLSCYAFSIEPLLFRDQRMPLTPGDLITGSSSLCDSVGKYS